MEWNECSGSRGARTRPRKSERNRWIFSGAEEACVTRFIRARVADQPLSEARSKHYTADSPAAAANSTSSWFIAATTSSNGGTGPKIIPDMAS